MARSLSWTVRSLTTVCGRLSWSDDQWSPLSNDTHTPNSVPRVEQIGIHRVFAHRADEGLVGDAGDDLLPALAEVGGPVDVRVRVVEEVDRGVGGPRVVVRGVHHVDVRAGRECRGGHVGPGLASVAREVNEAVIGAYPDLPGRDGGERNGLNDSARSVFRTGRDESSRRPRAEW